MTMTRPAAEISSKAANIQSFYNVVGTTATIKDYYGLLNVSTLSTLAEIITAYTAIATPTAAQTEARDVLIDATKKTAYDTELGELPLGNLERQASELASKTNEVKSYYKVKGFVAELKDYYAILGIPDTATPVDIVTAYRAIATPTPDQTEAYTNLLNNSAAYNAERNEVISASPLGHWEREASEIASKDASVKTFYTVTGTRAKLKDYYAILGVPETATPANIATAYATLGGSPTAAQAEAFSVLIDPAKKTAYDSERTEILNTLPMSAGEREASEIASKPDAVKAFYTVTGTRAKLKDYYADLGLTNTATPAQIVAAFVALGTPTPAQTEAFNVLGDSNKKSSYDDEYNEVHNITPPASLTRPASDITSKTDQQKGFYVVSGDSATLKDYYAILGVPETATPTEIVAAFTAIATPTADQTEAFNILGDPVKKLDYDAERTEVKNLANEDETLFGLIRNSKAGKFVKKHWKGVVTVVLAGALAIGIHSCVKKYDGKADITTPPGQSQEGTYPGQDQQETQTPGQQETQTPDQQETQTPEDQESQTPTYDEAAIKADAEKVYDSWSSVSAIYTKDQIAEIIKAIRGYDSTVTIDQVDEALIAIINNFSVSAINNAIIGSNEYPVGNLDFSALLERDDPAMAAVVAMQGYLNGAANNVEQLSEYAKQAFEAEAIIIGENGEFKGFKLDSASPAARIVMSRLIIVMNGMAGPLGPDFCVEVNGTVYTQADLNNAETFETIAKQAKTDLGNPGKSLSY